MSDQHAAKVPCVRREGCKYLMACDAAGFCQHKEQPTSNPVASRKLIDCPFELRPRYVYRDGAVDGWEQLYTSLAEPSVRQSSNLDFDADLARVNELRSNSIGDVKFLIGFIDNLWNEYTKAISDVDLLQSRLRRYAIDQEKHAVPPAAQSSNERITDVGSVDRLIERLQDQAADIRDLGNWKPFMDTLHHLHGELLCLTELRRASEPPTDARIQFEREVFNALIATGIYDRMNDRVAEDNADRIIDALIAEVEPILARYYNRQPVTKPAEPPTAALRDVVAERQRQVSVEGWAPEHDDEHNRGEMATAAACYALGHPGRSGFTHSWPWDEEWWKPKDQRRNLVRAGALIIAEIERLDRAASRQPSAFVDCQNCHVTVIPRNSGSCPACGATVTKSETQLSAPSTNGVYHGPAHRADETGLPSSADVRGILAGYVRAREDETPDEKTEAPPCQLDCRHPCPKCEAAGRPAVETKAAQDFTLDYGAFGGEPDECAR